MWRLIESALASFGVRLSLTPPVRHAPAHARVKAIVQRQAAARTVRTGLGRPRPPLRPHNEDETVEAVVLDAAARSVRSSGALCRGSRKGAWHLSVLPYPCGPRCCPFCLILAARVVEPQRAGLVDFQPGQGFVPQATDVRELVRIAGQAHVRHVIYE